MNVLAINSSAGKDGNTANISANMQALMERASLVADLNRNKNLFQHKVGAAVTAARRGGALSALDERRQ